MTRPPYQQRLSGHVNNKLRVRRDRDVTIYPGSAEVTQLVLGKWKCRTRHWPIIALETVTPPSDHWDCHGKS